MRGTNCRFLRHAERTVTWPVPCVTRLRVWTFYVAWVRGGHMRDKHWSVLRRRVYSGQSSRTSWRLRIVLIAVLNAETVNAGACDVNCRWSSARTRSSSFIRRSTRRTNDDACWRRDVVVVSAESVNRAWRIPDIQWRSWTMLIDAQDARDACWWSKRSGMPSDFVALTTWQTVHGGRSVGEGQAV